MKNLLITMVVLLNLLFLGCQERSITEPTQPSDNELLKDFIGQVQDKSIELNSILFDPYPIENSYYAINGQIDYQLTIVDYGTYFNKPSYIVYLNLSLKAEFSNFCTVCEPPFNHTPNGSLAIETNDILYLIENGNYTLVKSFPIQGRKDEMYLECRFIVTPTGIELDRMVLQLEEQDDTDRLQSSI